MPRIRAANIAAHKETTRRDLLEAAGALFRALGYQDTGLSDIASYAGIGRTTIYEYFSDKEDVLATLVEEAMPGVISGMLADLPEEVGAGPRLAELLVRGTAFVSTDEALGAELMRQLPVLSPTTQRRIRAAHAPLEHEIVALCRQGMEEGVFRRLDPEETGRLVFAVMTAASQSLIRDRDAKQRMHEAADTLVAFVFRGIAAA